MTGYSLRKVVSYDLDRNGVEDIFVELHAGPTGRNSSIIQVACFFYASDSLLAFHEISSFYGGLDLIRDYDQDTNFEFAAIKWENYGTTTYHVVNLFSISEGGFVNISALSNGYPVYARRKHDSGGIEIIDVEAFPSEIKELSYPSVWHR